MNKDLDVILQGTKRASYTLAGLSVEKKNAVLSTLRRLLTERKDAILAENAADVAEAEKKGVTSAFLNRLTLTEVIFDGILQQIDTIMSLPSPVGEIIEKQTLSNGILLQKVRVPLGVIGVIYESRPNVTIDVAALCIKSGNCAVLRGGSEAFRTNSIFAQVVRDALATEELPVESVVFIASTDRSLVAQMLKQDDTIDLIIPRGGYELARFVVENSTIPLLYHAAGGARIYVDVEADISKAVDICVNAKVSRPGTCNSMDTVVLHQDVAEQFLPLFERKLKDSGKDVEIRADEGATAYVMGKQATEEDFCTEFLDYIVSIKTVTELDEAIAFIQSHSKGHSEAIVSENKETVEQFIASLNPSAVFVNCSTRFHDGAEFGLGAEMGIATGKLHARGPVGLRELTTYKWVAYGDGQVR